MQKIYLVPKIIFGDDALDYLEDMTNEQIVMITDRFIASLPSFIKIKEGLAANNAVTVFKDVVPDPLIENIIEESELLAKLFPQLLSQLEVGQRLMRQRELSISLAKRVHRLTEICCNLSLFQQQAEQGLK